MNCKKLIIGAALVVAVATVSGFDGNQADYELQTEHYTVRQGDTLWAISAKYVDKNSYGPRDNREFMSGIVELNYDEVFKGRTPGLLLPGDVLRINYWVPIPVAAEFTRSETNE